MRRARLINALTKGVLDPRLAERIDLAHYYTSVRTAVNVVFRPQGGFRLRPGTRLSTAHRLRRRLEPVHVTEAMITAPNGGTKAALVSPDTRLAAATRNTRQTSTQSYTCSTGDRGPFTWPYEIEARTDLTVVKRSGLTRTPLTLNTTDDGTGTFVNEYIVTMASTSKVRLLFEAVSGEVIEITGPDEAVTFGLATSGTDTFTTSSVGAASFTVAELDLGSAIPIAFLDVVGFTCATGSFDDALAVEYYDGAAWVSVPSADDDTLSPRRNLRSAEKRTRRFGGAPGWSASAQHWRIIAHGAVGAGAISVDGIALWRETQRLSAWRPISFARSADDTLEMVMTDRNLDIFDGTAFVASVPLPFPSSELASVKPLGADDTLLLWHADFDPPRIVRHGEADEWNLDWVPWEYVPALSGTTTYLSNQDEIQIIEFPSLSAGSSLSLFLEHTRAAPITFSSAGALPGQIASALNALAVIGSGVTATLEASSPPKVRVVFAGAAGGRRWPKISALVAGSSSDPVTTLVQRGVKSDGAVIEPANGWPRCGLFIADRLAVGGPRAAAKDVLMSEYGNAWSLRPVWSPALATSAIRFRLGTDQDEIIQEMYLGRHLMIFTSTSEWWSDNRSWDATAAINIVLATRYGADDAIGVGFVEDTPLFVGQPEIDAEAGEGQVLRAMSYSEVKANYTAEPLNLLGPHLVNGVVAMAVQKARSINKGALVVLPNADGTMAMLTVLSSQEVLAMSLGRYDGGAVRHAFVDTAGRLYLIVERNGDAWIERSDDNALLDGTVSVTGAGITSVATPHLSNGSEAWAIIDGDIYGPLTVASGAVALPLATMAWAEVGKRIVPDVETNPIRAKLQEEQPFRLPARIYELELSLIDTSHVCIATNGGSLVEMDLRFSDGGPGSLDRGGEEPGDADMDTPEIERLFTGRVTKTGLLGFSRHPRVRISQTRPGALEVRAIRMEAAS